MKFKSNRERPNLLSVPLEKKSEEGDRIIKVTVKWDLLATEQNSDVVFACRFSAWGNKSISCIYG